MRYASRCHVRGFAEWRRTWDEVRELTGHQYYRSWFDLISFPSESSPSECDIEWRAYVGS